MKTGLKFLIISVVVLAPVFSVFFFSNTEALALSYGNAGDTFEKIEIRTTHYSVLSTNVFVLGGAYSGNVNERGLTTYFEYKRNDSNLNNDPEETIPIVRGGGANESGEFYTSPSLQLSSDYYFRAVGYLNENPNEKFYGNIISFRTGAPFITSIPYTVKFSGEWNDARGDWDYEVTPYRTPTCDPDTEVLINGGCVRQTSTPVTCTPPKVLDPATNTCITPTTSSTTPPTQPPTQPSSPPVTTTTPSSTTTNSRTGLVPCGTEKWPEGHIEGGKKVGGLIKNPCNFNYFMQMLNEVIEFIFKYLVVPIAAIMFAYAGFLMVTSGGSSESRTKAKSIFKNTVIGLVIAVGAYLIVTTLLAILGYTEIDRFFN